MTWEARMAARAKERTREAERQDLLKRAEFATAQYELAKDRPWLNGWPRISPHQVLIGTGVHCVGCGKLQGVTCVVFPEDWEARPEPDWPFTEVDCPIHRGI